jgi:hypothetical protein
MVVSPIMRRMNVVKACTVTCMVPRKVRIPVADTNP